MSWCRARSISGARHSNFFFVHLRVDKFLSHVLSLNERKRNIYKKKSLFFQKSIGKENQIRLLKNGARKRIKRCILIFDISSNLAAPKTELCKRVNERARYKERIKGACYNMFEC